MPKRPNPFGDCAPLQLKTHVGIKELAAGIRQEELMKPVYGEWSRIREIWTKPKMESHALLLFILQVWPTLGRKMNS